MTTIIDLEVENEERGNLALFIKETANAIQEGYGAGNCTPESVAFWTLYHNGDPAPGTFTCRVSLDQDELQDDEIASAMRKVTTEPSGEIQIFGNIVGRWETIEGTPTPA